MKNLLDFLFFELASLITIFIESLILFTTTSICLLASSEPPPLLNFAELKTIGFMGLKPLKNIPAVPIMFKTRPKVLNISVLLIFLSNLPTACGRCAVGFLFYGRGAVERQRTRDKWSMPKADGLSAAWYLRPRSIAKRSPSVAAQRFRALRSGGFRSTKF